VASCRALMSGLGHELPSCGGSATSALRLKAVILSRGIEVRKVLPKADIAMAGELLRPFEIACRVPAVVPLGVTERCS
jgi:hypothetical protein